jgi:thermitase
MEVVMKLHFGRASILVAGLLGAMSSAQAAEYIVKLKKTSDDTLALTQTLRTQGDVAVKDQHKAGSLLKIEFLTDDKKAEAARLVQLINDPRVEYVVENIKFHMFGTPNDPRFQEQWALQKVNAERAWDQTTGSKDIVVAVIDTGVDAQHEDLKENMWTNPDEIAGNGIDDDGNGFVDDTAGWDFRDGDNNPHDETSDKNPGHGTHCAGIIGAVGDNNKGISGMTQNVSIMPVRFLGADGSGDLMNGAKAIDYAVEKGADIISASWGAAVGRSAVAPILEAIERAQQKGVIFVAAAANDGKSNDTREVYPANAGLPNVISVAASQDDDTKPSWSNFGKMNVDLASPGHKILSTLPSNKYGLLSGTSMATPLVAGLVALMASSQKDDAALKPTVAKALLQATGSQVAIETACNCRVDADAVLTALDNQTLTVVPNAITLAPEADLQFEAFGGQGPYTYAVDNSSIAGMNENGMFHAVAEGETKVMVTDANGENATSLIIRVANKPEPSADCPLPNPMMCTLMCAVDPSLPWCQ